MPRRYRKRVSDEDEATRDSGFRDFINVENRREEPFPEEFAEGPYGAPREGAASARAAGPAETVPPPSRSWERRGRTRRPEGE